MHTHTCHCNKEDLYTNFVEVHHNLHVKRKFKTEKLPTKMWLHCEYVKTLYVLQRWSRVPYQYVCSVMLKLRNVLYYIITNHQKQNI